MGSVNRAPDDIVAECFSALMQTEFLDRRKFWVGRAWLAKARLE